MKILLVNESDTKGGAARAAYRLCAGLQGIGCDCRMLVQRRLGNDPVVIGPGPGLKGCLSLIRPYVDLLPSRLYPGRKRALFSTAFLGGAQLLDTIGKLVPDLVHLHWICHGFVRLSTLAMIDRPIVWTLHDMWPFTGGCHYDAGCNGYKKACGMCPVLGSSMENDLSRWILKRKQRAFKGLDLTIVSPSHWLARKARESRIFSQQDIRVIPNGLDLEIFKPVERKVARHAWSLPVDKRLILFGALGAANDQRKGLDLLVSALSRAADGMRDRAEVVIFGAAAQDHLDNFGLKVHFMGRLDDDAMLASLYSAADVFVAPSIQENLSNTVMEAMACATPCVAFDVGGMPDLIDHMVTGYLARPYDIADLAKGIAWVLFGKDSARHFLSMGARQKVEREFAIDHVARRYAFLYEEICRHKGPKDFHGNGHFRGGHNEA